MWPSPGPLPVAPRLSSTEEPLDVCRAKLHSRTVTGQPSHSPQQPRGSRRPRGAQPPLFDSPGPGSAALAPLPHGQRQPRLPGPGGGGGPSQGEEDPGRAARPGFGASHKMALSASAPPPRTRAEGRRCRRGSAPRAARSVRPAGAERSHGHSPPARGAEAPRPSHAARLGRAPPHIERGRNAATSAPAASSSSSSAAGTAAPPPPSSPALRSRPLFICGFSALQNGAQGGNERPPRPAGGGCARTLRGAAAGGAAAVPGWAAATSACLWGGGRHGESPLAPPGSGGSRGFLERRVKARRPNGPLSARIRAVRHGLLPAGGAAARRDGASGARLPPKRLRGAGPGASWEKRLAPSRKAGGEDGISAKENCAH